ncbi:MAG: hypothetical protein ACK4VN_12085 [Bacteroidales bacterium]
MFSIIKTDLKNIFRDPSLLIILFVPFVMMALVRWGFPALLQVWPPAADYVMHGLAMFSITIAIMPGIAIAFVMLDEKDNNLQTVLRITPVSLRRIVLYRMVSMYSLGFLMVMLLLTFSGIGVGTFVQHLLLSALVSLSAPLMSLLPAFLSSNKIEGAAMTKMLNFLIMLPIPAFLFPGTWSWLMLIFPAWWIYFAFIQVASPPLFLLAIAGGITLHGLILLGVWKFLVLKRV